jgi:hypothetical protein
MADVVDFPSTKREEPLVWQCNCGSFAFRLYSTCAPMGDACGTESVGACGCWQIREMTAPKLRGGRQRGG